MKKAVRRAAASLLSTTLFLSVAITPVLAKDRISSDLCPSCMSGAIEEHVTRNMSMTRVSHARMGINLEWIFMPFTKLEKFEV